MARPARESGRGEGVGCRPWLVAGEDGDIDGTEEGPVGEGLGEGEGIVEAVRDSQFCIEVRTDSRVETLSLCNGDAAVGSGKILVKTLTQSGAVGGDEPSDVLKR